MNKELSISIARSLFEKYIKEETYKRLELVASCAHVYLDIKEYGILDIHFNNSIAGFTEKEQVSNHQYIVYVLNILKELNIRYMESQRNYGINILCYNLTKETIYEYITLLKMEGKIS